MNFTRLGYIQQLFSIQWIFILLEQKHSTRKAETSPKDAEPDSNAIQHIHTARVKNTRKSTIITLCVKHVSDSDCQVITAID